MTTGSRYVPPEESQVTVGVLSGAHVINHMYLVVLPPLFGVLVESEALDVGLAELGAAMGVLGLVGTVMQLPYGYLADNHDRFVGFVANGLFGALGAGVMATAGSFPWLIAGAAIMGIGVAGHHPVHYPMIVQATTEKRRGRAFSVYEFAGLVGFAITPVLLTGILSSGLTWRHAIGAGGFLGGAYGVVGLGLLWAAGDDRLRRPVRDAESGDAEEFGGTPLARVRAGVRALLDTPSILAMAAFSFLIAIANWGVVSYAVVLLTDGYGVSLGAANVVLTGVFAFSGIWVLYGGVIIDKVARGPDTVIAGSFGLAAPLIAVVATLAIPPVAAVTMILLIGAAQGPSVPAISSVTDAFSAEENLGRNMAIITVGTYAGNGVAPPLIGWLIDAADLRTAFMFIAVVGLVAAFLMVGITRQYGDRAALRSSSAAE